MAALQKILTGFIAIVTAIPWDKPFVWCLLSFVGGCTFDRSFMVHPTPAAAHVIPAPVPSPPHPVRNWLDWLRPFKAAEVRTEDCHCPNVRKCEACDCQIAAVPFEPTPDPISTPETPPNITTDQPADDKPRPTDVIQSVIDQGVADQAKAAAVKPKKQPTPPASRAAGPSAACANGRCGQPSSASFPRPRLFGRRRG